MEVFYDGTWASSLMFGARSGSLATNGRTYRWNQIGDRCLFCEENTKETTEHLLVECAGHFGERRDLVQQIVDELGAEEWRRRTGGWGCCLGLRQIKDWWDTPRSIWSELWERDTNGWKPYAYVTVTK
jgi:hypothetical protein